MTIRLLALAAIMCTLVSAAPAQANPYRGEITAADVPVPIGADGVADGGTSHVSFEGAGYTHTVGRVSIRIVPLLSGLEENVKIDGNLRSSGSGHAVRYETYRDLIKESITLKSPETVRYSYDLALSDWVTTETDESRPVEIRDANSTVIVTYPYTNPVIKYAKDSTIDINPDRWGNLIVDVNGEDVIVMPKPFAIDSGGKRFEMDFKLEKNSKTISLIGDLAGAQYPVVIDPTERVTNGGFETGTKSGWETVIGYTDYYTVRSDGPYQGSYYLDVVGTGEYSGLRQTVNYTNTTSVSQAVKITGYNKYDIVFSNIWFEYGAWYINWPSQTAHDWQVMSTAPNLTGSSTYDLWTYASTHAHVDSVRADPSIWNPPVAEFTGSPISGNRPLTVQFTDTSNGSPTSWEWDFENDGMIDSSVQNPQHIYNESGSYSVNLTASNGDGSDTETKNGYVTVAGYYYVYADGVGKYYDPVPQSPLFPANHTPVFFYNRIVGRQGGNPSITWQGVGKPVDNATGSRNWDINYDANTKANYADFAFHAGHGWDDGFKFGTANYSYDMDRENLSFGGNYGRAKWVALFSCHVLNQSTKDNWKSVFNGLHILMGFDTVGILRMSQGTQFADRMTGNQTYDVTTIRESWISTLQSTIPDDLSVKGAYMYAYPSQNDYLPGFGTFRQPIKDNNGQYNLTWESFSC